MYMGSFQRGIVKRALPLPDGLTHSQWGCPPGEAFPAGLKKRIATSVRTGYNSFFQALVTQKNEHICTTFTLVYRLRPCAQLHPSERGPVREWQLSGVARRVPTAERETHGICYRSYGSISINPSFVSNIMSIHASAVLPS